MLRHVISKYLSPEKPFFDASVCGDQSGGANHLFMGACIDLLSKERGRVDVLEVGSWVGYSALTWAQSISSLCRDKGTVFCVDLWDGYFSGRDLSVDGVYATMDELGRSGIAYDVFLHNIGFAAQGVPVLHAKGPSGDVLPFLASDRFDLVYIDASHYYEHVKADLENAGRLLKVGGILCGDDLEVQAHRCDIELAKRHKTSDLVYDPSIRAQYHPGVTLAVAEVIGKVPQYGRFWAVRKTVDGYEPVDLRECQSVIPAHFSARQKQGLQDQARTILESVDVGLLSR